MYRRLAEERVDMQRLEKVFAHYRIYISIYYYREPDRRRLIGR